MSSDRLVASRVVAPVDPWAGVWIAEDIEQLAQAVSSGSWIDTGLGVVGAGLDALAFVSDPVGALLQYGVAWIIEHVRPLSEALDWLGGNPGQIAAHAQTWRDIAASMREQSADLGRYTGEDIADWRGTAADAYRRWNGQQRSAIDGLAKAADTLAAITEGAAFLVAGVRVLVRDAIAALVSRLIVYAAEEDASIGFATPMVVEQVSTLVAAWAAKIARWLKALLASLRRLAAIIRRLGELIEDMKKILNRLRGRGAGTRTGRRHESRQDLLDELERSHIKHNPGDIVEIGRDASGKIVFLEAGNSRAGLRHITDRHAQDFANIGVPQEKIPELVFTAVTDGTVVGAQRTRPIYEVLFEGKMYKIAVSVGENGFIVGANPVGH